MRHFVRHFNCVASCLRHPPSLQHGKRIQSQPSVRLTILAYRIVIVRGFASLFYIQIITILRELPLFKAQTHIIWSHHTVCSHILSASPIIPSSSWLSYSKASSGFVALHGFWPSMVEIRLCPLSTPQFFITHPPHPHFLFEQRYMKL